MNRPSATRQKVRAAMLSTTCLCVASMALPSVAFAELIPERVSNGQVVDVENAVLGRDVVVEHAGSRLIGNVVHLIDDAEMTVTDQGQAEFTWFGVGGFDTTGQVTVSNGGKLLVETDLIAGFDESGYGRLDVTGPNSVLTVGRDLILKSFGEYSEDSILTISDGAVVNVGNKLVMEANRNGRTELWIGGDGWGNAKAPGQLNTNQIVLNDKTHMTFNHTGRFEYSGTLSGTGSLTVLSGHSILSGDNSGFEGATFFLHPDGTLEVKGILGGTTHLGSGRLTGTGHVEYLYLSPALGGTIRPEATVPTVGDLRLGVFSALYVEVDPATGKSGTINVLGKAIIDDEAEIHHISGANNNFRRSASYVIIDAAGGVEGQFAIANSEFAFLDLSMDYTDTQVIMNLTRNDIRFVDIAETANQRAVAGAIEGIEDNLDLSDLVIDLNDENARLGFTQMAGELHASARSAMLLDAASLRQTLIGSVSNNEVSGQNYSVWGRVLGSAAKLDAQGENAELKSDTTGIVAGVDKAFGTSVRAGVMVGFEKAEMKSVGLGQLDRDSQHLGLYGRGDWGAVSVQAGTIASWHSLTSRRDVAFGNTAESLKGDYDASSQQAYVEAAWAVPTAWATLSPYASLAFNAMDVDGVDEKGGLTALSIASNSQDLTTAGLGLAAEKRWTVSSGRSANVSARVGWESYSGDLEAVQTVAFADSADFDIVGLPMGDEAFVAGVSVAVPVGKAGTVSLDWNGLKGSDQSRNALAVSYRLNF